MYFVKEDSDEDLSKLAETFFKDEKTTIDQPGVKKEKPSRKPLIRILPWTLLFIVTIAFLAFFIANEGIEININFPEGKSLGEISKAFFNKFSSARGKAKKYDEYEEWYIPDWVLASDNCVIDELIVYSLDNPTSTNSESLELKVNFPKANSWREVYVERLIDDEDWTFYKALSASVFLPEDAPRNLRARFILTCGENWHWTEMRRRIFLKPGNWNLVETSLEPIDIGGDWRYRGNIGDLMKNVRKLGIRIEADYSRSYEGSIYVKNIKLIK